MKCNFHSLWYARHKRIKFGTCYHYSKAVPWHVTPVFLAFPRFVYVCEIPALSSTGAFYVQICCPSAFLIPQSSKFVAVLHKLLQDQANSSCEKKNWTNALPFSVFLDVFGSSGRVKRMKWRSCRELTVWKPQRLTSATQEVAGCRLTVHHPLFRRNGRYLRELGAKTLQRCRP